MSNEIVLKTPEDVMRVLERFRSEMKSEIDRLDDRINQVQDLSEGNLGLSVSVIKKNRQTSEE